MVTTQSKGRSQNYGPLSVEYLESELEESSGRMVQPNVQENAFRCLDVSASPAPPSPSTHKLFC